jgi:hypothetical protein
VSPRFQSPGSFAFGFEFGIAAPGNAFRPVDRDHIANPSCESIGSCSNVEIERRIRFRLGISPLTRINPEVIRTRISTQLPLGSSIQQVNTFLEGTLAKDKFTICTNLTLKIYNSQDIVCSINSNTDSISLELRKVDYEIRFGINNNNKIGSKKAVKKEARARCKKLQ